MIFISENRPLTSEEQKVNAIAVREYLGKKGWTLQAICGFLGNTQAESRTNPGAWQGYKENLKLGYGIVQWTPATKFFEWADKAGMKRSHLETQLDRVIFELEKGLQFYKTKEYPMNFAEYTKSTDSPEHLAYVFLNNYERPGDRNQPHRQTNARTWYNYFIEREGKKLQGIVKGSNVNLRAGASVNDKVIGQLQAGQKLTVLEDAGSFLKVKVTTEVTAYISEKYVY